MMSGNRRLFEGGLDLLHGAHRQGAAQATRNNKTATLPKLKQMLEAGSKQNIVQLERLDEVFDSIGVRPDPRNDPAMQGICDLNEAEIAKHGDAADRDLINIEYGQVAAHFYIARYGTLRRAAHALGHAKAVKLLDRTLVETRAIDRAFTQLYDHLLSRRTSSRYPGETALATTAAMHPGLTVGLALGGVLAAAALVKAGRSKRR
jgi:ferritin-like metal-binding protein YciE